MIAFRHSLVVIGLTGMLVWATPVAPAWLRPRLNRRPGSSRLRRRP